MGASCDLEDTSDAPLVGVVVDIVHAWLIHDVICDTSSMFKKKYAFSFVMSLFCSTFAPIPMHCSGEHGMI